MSSGSSTPTIEEVLALLDTAKQQPTAPHFNNALQQCAIWLLAQDDKRHWFCPKDYGTDGPAFRNILTVSTFCLRLSEFKVKGFVADWKSRLDSCLSSCCTCVTGYVRAKHVLVEEYLSLIATPQDEINERFRRVLLTKEAEMLKNTLQQTTEPFQSAHLQLLLLQSSHTTSSVLIDLLEKSKLPDLPRELPPPPGLLVWSTSSLDTLRAFALDQIQHLSPLNIEDMPDPVIPWRSALRYLVRQVGSRPQSRESSEYQEFQCVTSADKQLLWTSILRVIPKLDKPVVLHATLGAAQQAAPDLGVRCPELVRIVCAHLGDTEQHWLVVLHCFVALLDKCGSEVWGGEDPAYSGIVMHTILDNTRLEDSMQQGRNVFGWTSPFLDSIKNTPLLQPHLSAILNILLVRFQLPRFDLLARTTGARAALRLLLKTFVSDAKNASSARMQAIRSELLDVHAQFLSQLSFSQPYACLLTSNRPVSSVEQDRRVEEHRAWSKVSSEARRLLAELLAQDSRSLSSYLIELSKFFKSATKSSDEPPRIKLCNSTWKASYDAIKSSKQNQAVHFAGSMLRAYAPMAHLDRPVDKVWLSDPTTGTVLKPVIRQLQNHFDACSVPLGDLLLDVADSSASKSNFIKQDKVCQDLMAAMLSPLDSIHQASMTVVREAYENTYSREQCFRKLLLHYPLPAIDAVQKSSAAFAQSALELPDSCGGAMRMARCLSSLLEALCDSEDGLLRDETWLGKEGVRSALPKLWDALCLTSARIYSKTPQWAVYHENEKMTAWMRDAVIFGNSLADELRSFEAAASGKSVGESPQKMSSIGSSMVNKAIAPVEALLSWLRLNDADLYRSTANLLVKFMVRFAKASVPLPTTFLQRIKKYATSTSSRTLDKAEIFKIVLVLQKHPLHRTEFEGLIEPQEEPRRKVSKLRPEPIEIDDDDDESTKNARQLSKKTPKIELGGSVKPKPSTSSAQMRQTTIDKKPPATIKDLLMKTPLKGKDSTSDKTKKEPSKSVVVQPRSSVRVPPPPPRQTFSHAALRKMQNSLSSDESSSEDDQDEEDGPKGLASIVNPINKRPKPDIEKRQVKPMLSVDQLQSKPLLPSKASQIVSDAKKAEFAARLRAAPDFTSLHRVMLQWDLSHTGPAPPHTPRPASRTVETFSSPSEYIAHFEPLLMLECWSSVCQARDELAANKAESISVTVSGRQSVDDFTEVFVVTRSSALPDRFFLSEADLVVLEDQNTKKRVMAKVQEFKRKGDNTTMVLRAHLGSDRSGVSNALVPRSLWRLDKLTSLSTMHREYAALRSLPYLVLCQDIIKARLPKPVPVSTDELEKTRRAFRTNEPQAMAILQASQGEGFSLIQGPPGTGKTSTILSLIGALCSQRGAVPREHSKTEPARLLVAAPSNAAVDELVRRLKDGIRSLYGDIFSPKVVRVGADSAISPSVRDVFFDELVDRQVNSTSKTDDAGSVKINELRAELDSIKVARTQKQNELDTLSNVSKPNVERINSLEEELRSLRRQNQQISIQLQEARDSQQAKTRAMDVSKRNIRMDILTNADVVCATLSGTGHDYMSLLPEFDTVIIDESAQSVELSCLIPLRYGCKRCVLVGDPQQLPPTVLSRVATNCGYDKSLFQRLQQHEPDHVQLLSIQYRMHPSISRFPSITFYNGKVQDGPGMAQKTIAPWHSNPLFPTFAFMHVRESREQRDNLRSIFNPAEASVALALYSAINNTLRPDAHTPSVGIVTAYAAQLRELKKQFRSRFGPSVFNLVDFNTVDGFQGQEKDIIILSCVRGGPQDTGIGFLSDERRMNVALTRARSSLFVLGNAVALQSNPRWGSLIDYAKTHNAFKDKYQHIFPSTVAYLPRAQVGTDSFTSARAYSAQGSASSVPARTTPPSKSKSSSKANFTPAVPEHPGLIAPQLLKEQKRSNLSSANSLPHTERPQPTGSKRPRDDHGPDVDKRKRLHSGSADNPHDPSMHKSKESAPADTERHLDKSQNRPAHSTPVSNPRERSGVSQAPNASQVAQGFNNSRPPPQLARKPPPQPKSGASSLFVPKKKR